MTIEQTHVGAHEGQLAVCLGNGPSRTGYLPPDGAVVIGCNAAYRDTQLDYVVALDRRVVREIIEAKFEKPLIARQHTFKKVIQEAGQKIDPQRHLLAVPPSLPLSGFLAIYVACIFRCDPIRLVGYDGGSANLYTGTPCYQQSNRRELERNNNLERGWKYLLQRFPNARYEIPEDSYMQHFKDAYHKSLR